MVPSLGDFVPTGRPLLVVPRSCTKGQIRTMLNCIALGEERTLRQDPAFAICLLVDIASRALSPAINGPTTAVDR